MRKTKIVCTLGPATNNEEKIQTAHVERHGCCTYEFFPW